MNSAEETKAIGDAKHDLQNVIESIGSVVIQETSSYTPSYRHRLSNLLNQLVYIRDELTR